MGPQINSVRTSHWLRTILVGVVLALPLTGGQGALGPAEGKAGAMPAAVEVRFTDGSVLKLDVHETRFTLETPYGKLLIPWADVQEIEFATRIPDDVARRISAAIADLGSAEHKKREAASATLIKLQEKAYPALLKAEKDRDPEVQKRARQALDTIRKAVSGDLLEMRDRDVVRTPHSRIAGKVDAVAFRAETVQFGAVRVKLSDIRTVRSQSYKPADRVIVHPRPGPMFLVPAR
jgi:hypothetical protein